MACPCWSKRAHVVSFTSEAKAKAKAKAKAELELEPEAGPAHPLRRAKTTVSVVSESPYSQVLRVQVQSPPPLQTRDRVVKVTTQAARRRAALNEFYILHNLPPHPNVARPTALHCVAEGESPIEGLPPPQRDTTYLQLVFCTGRDLYQILDDDDRVLPDNAWVYDVATQVVDAFGHLHVNNRYHLDFKPEAVVVAPNNLVTVVGFGLGFWDEDRTNGFNAAPARLFRVAGTPGYLAPEVASSAWTFAGYDPGPVDVWNVGLFLYFLCFGLEPPGLSPDDRPEDFCAAVANRTHLRWDADANCHPLAPVIRPMLNPLPAERPTMAGVQRTMEAVAGPEMWPSLTQSLPVLESRTLTARR